MELFSVNGFHGFVVTDQSTRASQILMENINFSGGQAVLHIADPEAAALVLSQSTKSPAYDHFLGFCGRGVFTAEGTEWREKRLSVLHALFKNNRLSSLDTIVNNQADILCSQIWSEIIRSAGYDSKSARKEGNIEMVGFLQRHTLTIIHSFLTGTNGIDKKYQHELMPQYLQAITDIRMVLLARARSIWMLASSWFYRNFSALYRREHSAMISIRSFSIATLDASQSVNSKETCPLAELSKRASHSSEGKYPGSMLDETITLLFAGQDTSAATLSWVFYLLSQNSAYRKMLRDEVVSVCGIQGPILPSHLGKLALVDSVIKETQRMYPVAPFVVRHITKDLILKGNNKRDNMLLPKSTLAVVWIYALHHHPDFWDDPEVFRPERWYRAPHDGTAKGVNRGAFLPFAAGPRGCLGQPFAFTSLRILLARIIRDFDLSLEGPADKEMQAGFTVLPLGGLNLKISKWKDA